jgi:hypothetical protein
MNVMFLLAGCSTNDYLVTHEYVYNSNGFRKGFTIQEIVFKDIKNKIPDLYSKGDVRMDLFYSDSGEVKKKIWFHKDNENYYWSYHYGKKYKTMPVNFEKGKWYLLWSNEFDTAMRTSRIEFYLSMDSMGKIQVYRNTVGKL